MKGLSLGSTLFRLTKVKPNLLTVIPLLLSTQSYLKIGIPKVP